MCNRDVNNAKRAFLAAPQHVERWANRLQHGSSTRSELARIADTARLEHRPTETISVARALYLRLPEHARLWVGQGHFEPADRRALARALDIAL